MACRLSRSVDTSRLFPTTYAQSNIKKIHAAMEQRIFSSADKITICSDTWKSDLESIGAKDVGVIVWGYDEDDFKNISVPLSKIYFEAISEVWDPDRNAKTLWKALSIIAKENKQFANDLEIELAGFVGHAIVDEINSLGLTNNLKLSAHISRRETLERMHQSQILLLILNDMPNVKGRLPGKLFEYLASRRPYSLSVRKIAMRQKLSMVLMPATLAISMILKKH